MKKKYNTEEERKFAHVEAVRRCNEKRKLGLTKTNEKSNYKMKFFITDQKEIALEKILEKHRALFNIKIIIAEDFIKTSGKETAYIIIRNKLRNINSSLLYVVKQLDEELIENVREEVSMNKRIIDFSVI
jgi:hypothetical protein